MWLISVECVQAVLPPAAPSLSLPPRWAGPSSLLWVSVWCSWLQRTDHHGVSTLWFLLLLFIHVPLFFFFSCYILCLLMKDSWSWPWARAVSCVVIVRHQTAESGSLLPGNSGRRSCAPNSVQKSAELRGAVKSASHCGRHHRSTQFGPGRVTRALYALLSCAEADQTQLNTRQRAARALIITYRSVLLMKDLIHDQ